MSTAASSSAGAARPTHWLGLAAGHTSNAAADRLLHRLATELPLPAEALGQSHRVGDGRLGLSLGLPDADTAGAVARRLAKAAPEAALAAPGAAPRGPAAWAADAATALAAAPDGGRVVLFPGQADLPALLTVAELLSRTAIEAVRVLGGATAAPDALVETHDHLRPERRDDTLLLRLTPARTGFIPFEIPDPHPCCGGEH
ncbi:hypothetical protein RM844_10940 [Streptomyces sp. DSM 44915]|uniref:Uncharacterized protein n=1 Tax=Streptomyces chisholmiae TaxID=3075540 RepID=A0ABU2JP88_9ACTN|nr:hypothetical protein [Streptomyces sp. DSM 44915]MDT0266808.1 hypothetical protein [Streptomyces sp. DSM 44915]